MVDRTLPYSIRKLPPGPKRDAELERRTQIAHRAGGWFATGESWSGPWKTEEAAKLARDGKYDEAHRLERGSK